MTDITDNTDRQRFELRVDGRIAHADYTIDGDVITFVHTRVPAELEGHGVGSRLIGGALAQVRARRLKVVPQCPFVAAYMQRHPETQDLLAKPADAR